MMDQAKNKQKDWTFLLPFPKLMHQWVDELRMPHFNAPKVMKKAPPKQHIVHTSVGFDGHNASDVH